MRFKFSIAQLLIVTTVFAVLTGIAIRMDLVASDWWVICLLATVYLGYLMFVGTIFGPRYYRDFVQFQNDRQRQRVTRAQLEHEIQSKQAALQKQKESDSA